MNKALRKLLVLALAIVLSASAIVGGTYAWFTDTVTSAKNTIEAGNLDMVVEYKTKEMLDNGVDWAPVTENTKIFNEAALYEPGYVETVFLRVANAGNLAFKYQLGLNVKDTVTPTSVYGNEIKLSEHMEIGCHRMDESLGQYLLPGMFDTRDEAVTHIEGSNGSGFKNMDAAEGETVLFTDAPLVAKTNPTYSPALVALVLRMPEGVGNEANWDGKGQAPAMEIGLNVLATQFVEEKDSFDNQYDAGAKYDDPNVPNAVMTTLTDSDLTINCTNEYNGAAGLTFYDGELTLDCGVKYVTYDKEEDLADKDYADWAVDFEIKSTKALSEEDTTPHIALAGYYDFPGLDGEWLAFDVSGIELAANEAQRVVAVWDDNLTYREIVTSVKEFSCGIKLLDDYFKGETITLTLCMYEPDGTRHEVSTYEHKC